MIRIYWRFKKDDVNRIDRALSLIIQNARVQEWMHPLDGAQDYRKLLLEAIVTQKYAGRYAPYSPRYAEWKTVKMMRGSHFWNLFGDLLRSLTVQRRSRGYFAGIPEGVYDSGGKSWFSSRNKRVGRPKPIAMYGRVMEEGLANHPARPVFAPSLDEYVQSGAWLKRAQLAHKRMVAPWKRR